MHGGYGRYLRQGKLRAMVQPEHQDELLRWVAAFVQLDLPLIVKFHGQSERAHLFSALRRMANLPVLGVHVNVRDDETQRPNVELVRDLLPGETAALEQLTDFVDGTVGDYGEDRNRPDRQGTSRLSPHLHFGEISPRQVWHGVRHLADAGRGEDGGGGGRPGKRCLANLALTQQGNRGKLSQAVFKNCP